MAVQFWTGEIASGQTKQYCMNMGDALSDVPKIVQLELKDKPYRLRFILLPGKATDAVVYSYLECIDSYQSLSPVDNNIEICKDMSGKFSPILISHNEHANIVPIPVILTARNWDDSDEGDLYKYTCVLGYKFIDSCRNKLCIYNKAKFYMRIVVPYRNLKDAFSVAASEQKWMVSSFVEIPEGAE